MSTARLFATSAALLIASMASAQTTLPFSIKVQLGTTTTNAGDGAAVAFAADAIGRPVDATLNIVHVGVLPANAPPTAPTVGTATITAIDLSGSTDFSLTGNP